MSFVNWEKLLLQSEKNVKQYDSRENNSQYQNSYRPYYNDSYNNNNHANRYGNRGFSSVNRFGEDSSLYPIIRRKNERFLSEIEDERYNHRNCRNSNSRHNENINNFRNNRDYEKEKQQICRFYDTKFEQVDRQFYKELYNLLTSPQYINIINFSKRMPVFNVDLKTSLMELMYEPKINGAGVKNQSIKAFFFNEIQKKGGDTTLPENIRYKYLQLSNRISAMECGRNIEKKNILKKKECELQYVTQDEKREMDEKRARTKGDNMMDQSSKYWPEREYDFKDRMRNCNIGTMNNNNNQRFNGKMVSNTNNWTNGMKQEFKN